MKIILRSYRYGHRRDSDFDSVEEAAKYAVEAIEWDTSCPVQIELESGEIIWDREDDRNLHKLYELACLPDDL